MIEKTMKVRPITTLVIGLLFLRVIWSQNPGAVNARAEQDASGFTLRAAANEVHLVFTVSDKHGHYINNLKQNDFEILDDRKPPEQILSFHSETDLPLQVGLLIDTSQSVRARFRFEQEAATEFLNQTIRRNYDQAFVIGFALKPEVTQEPPGTGSRWPTRPLSDRNLLIVTVTATMGRVSGHDIAGRVHVRCRDLPSLPPLTTVKGAALTTNLSLRSGRSGLGWLWEGPGWLWRGSLGTLLPPVFHGINVAAPMAGRTVCFQRKGPRDDHRYQTIREKTSTALSIGGLGDDNAWRRHGASTDLARDADEIDVLMS